MRLITFIKDYIGRAKQEAAGNYSLPSPDASHNAAVGGNVPGNKNERRAWIGVDLDGTLARDDTRFSLDTIGSPVPKMVDRVKGILEKGTAVKIFTARACDREQRVLIKQWLKDNGLPDLDITNVKDYDMIRLYDDRAVQVVANTGETVDNQN